MRKETYRGSKGIQNVFGQMYYIPKRLGCQVLSMPIDHSLAGWSGQPSRAGVYAQMRKP